ncbi:Phospholipid/glycerol acyltransferase [Penicillium griseofulvum]|uniref:Tafazzin family protein n=1 Tax=Penicillium patulum TaxID=5078 RepID=A0A135LHK0_PENPA|nr:Phospholipid/glycerol acyltransferase [Penicillium griseofulvum]KXG48429.1 Phospholipid/glycerol acyltransferase [Penicillium griseofulvum]
MDSSATAEAPSLPWRALSNTTMWGVAGLCRGFLSVFCHAECHGKEAFTELLDSRRDVSQRTRGLITVSNHISVPLSLFFTMGQVLPTHRSAHSTFGGLAQPAMTEAIRLLSKGPFPLDHHRAVPERQRWSWHNVCVDPFSDLQVAYTTDGKDSHLAPTAYSCNSNSWVHIFPEGKIHQSPRKTMRYFKWGIARLILEPKECPDVVPMWIEGFDDVMHESREFPRFLPRPGKNVSVTFGSKVESEVVFGEMRSRWQKLKARVEKSHPDSRDMPLGVLSDELLNDKEAIELRKEVTLKIRNLVLDVRRSRGLPDEDPKEGLVETWLEEGPKREGHMKDDSWVRDI